jgi:hypothetical protein
MDEFGMLDGGQQFGPPCYAQWRVNIIDKLKYEPKTAVVDTLN